jgi:hypothetical protein
MSEQEDQTGEEAEEAEIGDEVLPAPLLDLEKLDADMAAREARMRANPKHRGDVDLTFSVWGQDLRKATSEQAISEAFNAQAQLRMADYDARGVGQKAKDKTLAGKILAGEFDKD